MVIQDDYIDMDLTPAATPEPSPASPRFEFQSAGAAAAGDRHREAAFASPADELFYKGNLLPLHLPPRLQLVQRLLQDQEQQPPLRGAKRDAESDATAAAAAERGDADAAAAASKVVKRWASKEYIRSLFLARPPLPSDIVAAAGGASGHGIGSVSARGSVLEQEEVCQCQHRKSFSGIIRRVRLVATKAPGTSPLCSSSSSSSSSSTPSCRNANGFFFRTPASASAAGATPALKRSSSAGSSEEGAIQGAIAHCKRSQLLQPGMVASAAARRSVSDVMFYSVTNTPRASSVTAGEVAQERRQEMCRG